jgi:hypothetical protein
MQHREASVEGGEFRSSLTGKLGQPGVGHLFRPLEMAVRDLGVAEGIGPVLVLGVTREHLKGRPGGCGTSISGERHVRPEERSLRDEARRESAAPDPFEPTDDLRVMDVSIQKQGDEDVAIQEPRHDGSLSST